MVNTVIRIGVYNGDGVGVGVDIAGRICASGVVGYGGHSFGATSCSCLSRFIFEKFKKHDDVFIMYVQTLSEVAK